MSEVKPKRLAVIGAGASGLPAIKACLEAEAEVVCFERTGDLGGLWNYREDLGKNSGTVYRSTIINTSKEMMAFSDFPPPAHVPNFMHNSILNDYLHAYAKQFRLHEHIRFHTTVHEVRKAEDYAGTGRLVVISSGNNNTERVEETFEGVLVCTGHHAFPFSPSLPGLESFTGTIRHSQEYKTPAGTEGKRVLVVGIGNSALDAAVELARADTKQVYLSTRRGAWIWNRVGKQGYPYDIWYISRVWDGVRRVFGVFLSSLYLEHQVNRRMDHDMYAIRPKHHFLQGHPSVNDLLPNAILSGRIQIKGDISMVKGNWVEFADGSSAEVDEILLCTGYQLRFPFNLQDGLVQSTGENRVSLYKLVFPPEPAHHSLAFIGYIQPIGAIQPISEQQARWAAAVMTGQQTLPPLPAMQRDIDARTLAMKKRYFDSPKHTIQVDYVEYMDELAKVFGNSPLNAPLLLRDPRLAWSVLLGPTTPYQFRLRGPGAWSGARNAVVTALKKSKIEDRVRAPLVGRKSAEHAPLNWETIVDAKFILKCLVVLLVLAVCAGGAALGTGLEPAVAIALAFVALIITFLTDFLLDVSTLF